MALPPILPWAVTTIYYLLYVSQIVQYEMIFQKNLERIFHLEKQMAKLVFDNSSRTKGTHSPDLERSKQFRIKKFTFAEEIINPPPAKCTLRPLNKMLMLCLFTTYSGSVTNCQPRQQGQLTSNYCLSLSHH